MMPVKVGETVWLTRYALSARKIKTGKITHVFGAKVYVAGDELGKGYILGLDFAVTEAEAITIAEAARLKKIASLRESIAKLETLKFEAAS